jgi:hypothetical protein
MSAVLKFPVSEGVQKKRTLAANVRPDPVLRTFSRDDSRALLGVAQKVCQGISVLLDLVDSHRETARDAGVETVAIELASERKNVERILDTLEESELKGSDAQLSLDGLELLRRSEKLLAEATSNISRFTNHVPSEKKNLLGQTGKTPSSDTLLWGSLLLFGAVAVTVAMVAISSSNSEKD